MTPTRVRLDRIRRDDNLVLYPACRTHIHQITDVRSDDDRMVVQFAGGRLSGPADLLVTITRSEVAK